MDGVCHTRDDWDHVPYRVNIIAAYGLVTGRNGASMAMALAHFARLFLHNQNDIFIETHVQ